MTQGKITASAAMLNVLKTWGVDTIYGIPSGTLSSLMDALAEDKDIRFLQVRHEETGALAAVMQEDPAKKARRKSRKDLAAGDDAFLDEYDGDESFRKATDSDSAEETRLLESGAIAAQAPTPRPRSSAPDAPTEMLTQMRPAVAPAPVQVPAHVPDPEPEDEPAPPY